MYSGYLQGGALSLSVNFAKMNLTINAAKALDPNRDPRQKAQKGEKIYDWENSVWFTLNTTECQEIMNYLNNKPLPQAKVKDGKLHEMHSSGNGYNFFDFWINGDKPCISVGAGKATVFLSLHSEAYNAFLSGVNFILNQVCWYNDFLKEMGKLVAGRSSFNPGNGPDGKPWSESNNSYNNGGNNYNPNNGDGSWSNNVSYTPNQDSGYQQPQGGYQKKQYSNSNGYQKKQYSNNYNNGGNYQRNNYQPQANVQPPRPPQQAYQAPQNNVPPTPPQPMAQPPVPPQPMNNNQPPVPPAPPVDFDMSM